MSSIKEKEGHRGGSDYTGQPLFTPISHPRLSRYGKREVRKFLKDRERYILAIDDAVKSGAEIEPVSVKASIDTELLESFVFFRYLGPEVTAKDKVTDNLLLDFLKKDLEDSLDDITADELCSLIRKNVYIRMNEPDAAFRIRALLFAYHKFLSQRHWESIIETNPKVAVGHICSLLKPPGLKSRIEGTLQLSKKHLRKDWHGFCQYIENEAVQFDRYVSENLPESSSSSLKNTKNNKSKASIVGGKHLSDKKPPNDKQHHQGNIRTKNELKKGNENKEVVGQSALPKQELPDCLNPDCDEKHYIRDCDVTPADLKKELVKQFRAKTSPGKINSLSTKIVGKPPYIPPGRLSGRFSDKIEIVVCGDYGADEAAISDDHLQACHDAGIFVPILQLREPVQATLAMKKDSEQDNAIFTATKKARITLTVDTPGGPLRLRNVEFLVFPHKMDEVLLSRPLLRLMGFDLPSHLSSVREKFNDIDLSSLATLRDPVSGKEHPPPDEPSSLATLLLKNSTTIPKFDEDYISEPPELCGDECASETDAHLQNALKEAVRNGLPTDHTETLTHLINEYRDIFRSRLGSDPPARVPPMKISLKKGVKPFKAKQRRYSVAQNSFLRDKTNQLLRLGLAYRNPSSRWASAPLIIPKPKASEQWRFTVDLRAVNALTEKYAWPMPNLESTLSKLQGSKYYFLIDLCNGYWQAPLHPDSQECQSILTAEEVITPTRVLQGQTNAVFYFHSTIQQLLRGLQDQLLLWIDDILGHDHAISGLLSLLRQFFQICREYNLKLHAKKCHFFLKQVVWCGRNISKDGIKFDPSGLSALLEMPKPQTGAELQQFVCAVGWMRTSIPEYTKLIEPLYSLLEEVYKIAKGRKKRAVTKVELLQAGWSQRHADCFNAVKDALSNACTLAFPDSKKLLCLFTDASDRHWSAVLTQIPAEDKDLSNSEQRHEPLSFLSGSFTNASYNWSTPEKEAFAIYYACTRLDHFLVRPEGFLIYTDHKNLTFIFSPQVVNSTIPRHVASKIQRWAFTLSAFNYEVIHISGESNVWADLLSRWGGPPTTKTPRLSALFTAPISPFLDSEFVWPTSTDIHKSQQLHKSTANLKILSLDDNKLLVTRKGAIWIPPQDTTLQLRLCIIGHCGPAGHRGSITTLKSIKEKFYWRNMDHDITLFCNSCLHCLATTDGTRIPRPMGHAIHTDKPNGILHFDFLTMFPSEDKMEYVLILLDDASSYVVLYPCQAATSDEAARCLLNWFSLFGVCTYWTSDQGPHFKNELIRELNRKLYAHHHFTTANMPQANGTVERVCQEVLRATRALLSEFRLDEKQWTFVLPLIQSILNHTPRKSLANETPIRAFTGLPPKTPLTSIMAPDGVKVRSLDFIKAQKIINVNSLIHSLEAMHRKVHEARTKKRCESVKAHNAKTNVQEVNFEIGEYVLVSKLRSNSKKKLGVQWQGPYQVVGTVNSFVSIVRNLITHKDLEVHNSRLKFYSDADFMVTEQLLKTVENNAPHYETITKMLKLRFNDSKNRYEVQCKWRGFAHEEPGWEPLQILFEDVPDMLNQFLTSYHDQELASAARSSLDDS